MRRKIMGLAGESAQFALADDGSVWFWTGSAWQPWERKDLPDAPGIDYFAPPDVTAPPWPTTQGVPEPQSVTTFYGDGKRVVVVDPAVPGKDASGLQTLKRGPGRPRKVQP